MDKESLDDVLGAPKPEEVYTTLGTAFSTLGTVNLILGVASNPGFLIPMAGFYVAGMGCYVKGWFDKKKIKALFLPFPCDDDDAYRRDDFYCREEYVVQS